MDDFQYKELKKDIEELRKESKTQTFQSHIQTAAVLLVFFFGIVQISDLIKKTSK